MITFRNERFHRPKQEPVMNIPQQIWWVVMIISVFFFTGDLSALPF